MNAMPVSETLVPVGTDEKARRGAQLEAAAEARGLSRAAVSRLSGLSDPTVKAVYHGTASIASFVEVEKALKFADESPGDVPSEAPEIELAGPHGGTGESIVAYEVHGLRRTEQEFSAEKLIIRGPVEDREGLRADFMKVLAEWERSGATTVVEIAPED